MIELYVKPACYSGLMIKIEKFLKGNNKFINILEQIVELIK